MALKHIKFPFGSTVKVEIEVELGVEVKIYNQDSFELELFMAERFVIA